MLFDERASYDTMLAEAWSDTLKSREAAKRLLKKLRDAEQAHVPWAAAELEALLLDGARERCRTWRQSQGPKVLTPEGREVKTTGGSVRRDPTSGELLHEQLAFADMGRPQIRAKIRSLSKEVATEMATIAALTRLLDALNRVPEATTAGEACLALGTTVEMVLAGREIAV